MNLSVLYIPTYWFPISLLFIVQDICISQKLIENTDKFPQKVTSGKRKVNFFSFTRCERLGCPKITPSVKWLAPEAFSGAKLQVFMENGQKNEID